MNLADCVWSLDWVERVRYRAREAKLCWAEWTGQALGGHGAVVWLGSAREKHFRRGEWD